MGLYRRIIKTLASLKLAVLVLISIATIVAWGTIVEAQFNDAKMAGALVFHSWYSYGILGMLSVNLIAVILDRYPWKKDHISFISAHVGILMLLGGSLLTRYYGIDGSMAIEIGKKSDKVSLPMTELTVYGSLNGSDYRTLFQEEVHFLKNPPTADAPYLIDLPGGKFEFTEFYPYSLIESKVVPKPGGKPSVRFQFANDRVTQSNWISATPGRPGRVALGPAQVVMTIEKSFNYQGGNVLHLYPVDKKTLGYNVYSDRAKKRTKQGQVRAGETFQLGWMNLELRLLKYIPESEQKFSFKKMERSSDLTSSALKFDFNGKESWIGLNSMVRFFADSELYILTYGNKQIPLDFQIELTDFKVGRYQGTRRAASYASRVRLPGSSEEITISMNEPLHHQGLTFYQASFQEDEMGRPTTSVLSVNYDPGRWVKYLGSLLIVFGSAHLFYRRRKRKKKSA